MKITKVLILMVLVSVYTLQTVHAQEVCKEGDRRVCGIYVGICEPGRSLCKDGKWGDCEGMAGPKESDICGNGLDDNCDGAIDEGCFPWTSLVLIGTGMLFIGIGMYYMERGKGERMLREGVGKD